jgi:hypothetical protein
VDRKDGAKWARARRRQGEICNRCGAGRGAGDTVWDVAVAVAVAGRGRGRGAAQKAKEVEGTIGVVDAG